MFLDLCVCVGLGLGLGLGLERGVELPDRVAMSLRIIFVFRIHIILFKWWSL